MVVVSGRSTESLAINMPVRHQDTPVTSERPIAPDEQSEFESYAQEGLRILGAQASDEPGSIVAAVDAYVDRFQRQRPSLIGKLFGKKPNHVELSLALGIVWANQVVREFGWEWICVAKNGRDYYVIANRERSLTIYATYFIKECLDYPAADCTAMLSFNMLRAGSIAGEIPGSYASVMPTIFRIIPKSAVGKVDG